jgi:hypothetical protein
LGRSMPRESAAPPPCPFTRRPGTDSGNTAATVDFEHDEPDRIRAGLVVVDLVDDGDTRWGLCTCCQAVITETQAELNHQSFTRGRKGGEEKHHCAILYCLAAFLPSFRRDLRADIQKEPQVCLSW